MGKEVSDHPDPGTVAGMGNCDGPSAQAWKVPSPGSLPSLLERNGDAVNHILSHIHILQRIQF